MPLRGRGCGAAAPKILSDVAQWRRFFIAAFSPKLCTN
jgi:hypothetical protein